MGIKHNLKRNAVQIWAINKISLKMGLRFKFNFIMSFINPLISVFIPIFLLTFIFQNNIIGSNGTIGVFAAENYISLILLGYCGVLFGGFFSAYSSRFTTEKYWLTLPALIIAPFNRFNLLLGIFFANFITISIPFFVILMLNFFLSPSAPSFLIILVVILVYILYALTLSGIGLVLGALAISRENWVSLFSTGYRLVTLFNCVTYPKEIFPELIHPIIDLNPFFHFFELNRNLWVFNNIFYPTNGIHFLFVLICPVTSLIIGIVLFNKIYKRFGIEGY